MDNHMYREYKRHDYSYSKTIFEGDKGCLFKVTIYN